MFYRFKLRVLLFINFYLPANICTYPSYLAIDLPTYLPNLPSYLAYLGPIPPAYLPNYLI